MKKVTVIALATQREATLDALQRLGVLHVHASRAQGESVAEALDRLRQVVRMRQVAADAAGGVDAPGDAEKTDPAEAIAHIASLDARREDVREARAQDARRRAELAVWGEFDPERIRQLRENGVYVTLYRCAPEEMPDAHEGYALYEVARDASFVACAVVGREPFTCDLPDVPLPDVPPSKLDEKIAEYDRELEEIAAKIAAYHGMDDALDAYEKQCEDAYSLAAARDAMGREDILAYLEGYVPADDVDNVRAAAEENGWGIVIGDPAPDDEPPTLIRNPAWLRPVETVFSFIDTYPGYRERDISGVFYFFFSIFYAMLIGDAGYGAVLLLLTIAIHAWKGRSIPKQPLYLMYVLNIATIVWGVITGSYFGVTLPDQALVSRCVVLDSTDFGKTVYLCFILAVVQLVIAHVWNAVRVINSIRAVGELGYAGIVITMYFVANTLILDKPFPAWMGIVGGVSIVLALAGSAIGKKGEDLVATIFQFPFSVINSFGDIASYIRLFAVGFASLATAQAFNEIAVRIGFSNVFAGLGAALILAVGHALNMVLGLLAVMVHGLRLNMLEFSTHLGQEWSGEKYDPLRRQHSARAEMPAQE